MSADTNTVRALSEALGRPGAGSVRASTPAILARLRETSGLPSAGRSNLLWIARIFLEYLARVADDRWEGMTPQMIHDFCAGDWTDPTSGRKPSRSEQSRKQRRWGVRRVLPVLVSTGAFAAGSDIAECLNPQPRAARPGVSDTDPERIAHVIDTWQRRYADSSHGEALAFEARDCVQIAAPAHVSAAKTQLLSVYEALEWGLEKFGTIDRRAVLHPVNVESLIMDPDKAWNASWRAQMRSALRFVGRAVCPDLWPDPPQPIAARDALAPYSSTEEFLLREAASMAGRKPRCERLALSGLTLGAGLSGAQAYRTGTGDIVELSGDRLAVRVQRDRLRIVPIREDYTELVAEARLLRGYGRFFSSSSKAAPTSTAARIRVDGLGHLLIHRARATFVCAHIRAGTPLDVLNEIAGPISGPYLQQMLAHCAGNIDPTQAANRGLLP